MVDRHFLFAFAFVCLCAAGCDEPTRPDPRIPPQVGTPNTLTMLPCEFVTPLARCPVWAGWGFLYASGRNVTQEAQWSSSAPDVVRVAAPGLLARASALGDAVITIEFSGKRLTEKFRVFSEGPPWRVYGGEYHIEVTDAAGAALEGVLVEIIAGGDAGKQAMSDRNGRAIFPGETVCGPITVRGTKVGYREWVGSAIRCGPAGNGNWGSETIGPLRMMPLS